MQECENGEFKTVIAQPSSIEKQKRHINLLLIQDFNQTEESIPENSFFNYECLNVTKKRKVTVLKHTYKFHYV